MRAMIVAVLVSSLATAVAVPASGQDIPEMRQAKDLLLPCQEADNDPRDGFIVQLECVGFIRGFVAAIDLIGEGTGLCLPEANRDDQIRRAYVSWVHAAFSSRSKMPVGEALRAALEDRFGCP